VVELTDFTVEQTSDLNERHGQPLTETQENQLFDLLGGHPYLTRRALYLVASRRDTFAELMEKACEDNGPFGDHLRNYLFRMGDQEKLKEGLVQIIKYQRCSDEHVFFQLRGSGLAKRRSDNSIVLRNKLYADYFGKRLNA
jgi:hypothetical protein